MSSKSKELLLMLIDVVGYSRMKPRDQERVVKDISSKWDQNVKKHWEGTKWPRISIGDGFIFPGDLNAGVIKSFLKFIVYRETTNARERDESKYSVRYALHSGHCLDVGGNFLGHPMNELARIATCAAEGQILASSTFFKNIQDFMEDGNDVCYDEYNVKFKHDTWSFSGLNVDLSGGTGHPRLVDRTVYNLIIPADPKSGNPNPHYGSPRIPEHAIKYTGRNNYHHKYQFGPSFLFRSEEELFRYYCTDDNSRLMCLAYRDQYIRLPYAVEFAVKKGATVLVNDKIEEKHSALDNPQLIRLRKAYYPKHFSTDRLCLYNLVVDKANSQIKLTIHLTKHTYDESIVGERSADWSPHGGGYTKKKCQRDLLWEKNHGLPELTDMGLTNTIGVSAWILSADEILIVTQRAEEGLHSNVGSLSISASAGADWCDRLEFSGNRLDGKVPDDSTLVDCKRLVMAAVV